MTILNIFQRLLSWFLSKFKSRKQIQVEYIPDFCEVDSCKEKLFTTNSKKCKYCGQYFCNNHIAPAEKHNCEGNLKSIKHGYRVEYSKGKTIITSK